MRAIVFVLSAVLLSGCASIFSQSTYSVLIDSKPSNVNFTISCYSQCSGYIDPDKVFQTPYVLNLGGKSYYMLTLNPGQEDEVKVQIKGDISNWYWLNIFNFYGFGIDYLTSKMFALPDNITIRLLDDIPNTFDNPKSSTSTTN